MNKSALISECGKYRYTLTREWDVTKGKIVFIMLNPSTADAEFDDPTIRRCINFAKDWGYGSLTVGNLYAYRTSSPEVLFARNNTVEENKINDEWLKTICYTNAVILAYGAKKLSINRARQVMETLSDITMIGLYHLGLSKDGYPRHPLYLPGDTKPIKWESK